MKPTDVLIEQVANRQHGVATRAQLLAAGALARDVDARVKRGWLVVVHHAVYRLGSRAPCKWTCAMAAALAASRGSVVAISHSAAAELWHYPGWTAPVQVDVTGERPRRVPGIRVHRVLRLADDEVTCLRGVTVTTRARTVLDLAADASKRQLEQALAAAERGSAGCCLQISRLLERHRHHAGSGRLRQLVATLDPAGVSPLFLRSELEERALALIRAAGLPEPRSNSRVASFEVDFVWPRQRVILEVDGLAFHHSEKSFHRDRARDRALAAAGYQVLRFTWQQLTTASHACVAALSVALVRGPPHQNDQSPVLST